MYKDISMYNRLDRIGELLAKGVYLYLKNEKSSADPTTKEKKKTNRAPAKREVKMNN